MIIHNVYQQNEDTAMISRTTVEAFLDPQTGTVSYVVSDNATACAAIVDPIPAATGG